VNLAAEPGLRRLLLDVSYTRTQHQAVGITRAVRRLAQEFSPVAQARGARCETVAFHRQGFRTADLPRERGQATQRPWMRAVTRTRLKVGVEAVLALPWPLVRGPWEAASAHAYSASARDGARVEFGPGDLLLMADASWNYPAWRNARMARARGARVVLVVYDLIPLVQPEFSVRWVRAAFERWLGLMLACSHAVVCDSHTALRDLRAYAAGRGWPLPPSGAFRLGCDPAPDSPGGGGVRPALAEFLAAGPCFLCVGTLEPRKNHAFVLQAFERLWAAGESVRWLVIGRPSTDNAALMQRLRDHPEAGRRLLWIEDGSDAELDAAYARSRALVFASLAEGFGLPLVEARVRGCPAIAGDLPVFVELADAGVRFFDRSNGDALLAAVLEDARKDRRAEAGAMPAFTWRESAAQCLALAEHLLAEGRA
jgi:glycosyltransferase involved in cell wall biosynthesis